MYHSTLTLCKISLMMIRLDTFIQHRFNNINVVGINLSLAKHTVVVSIEPVVDQLRKMVGKRDENNEEIFDWQSKMQQHLIYL